MLYNKSYLNIKEQTASLFSGCLFFVVLAFFIPSAYADKAAQTRQKLEQVQQQILATQTQLKKTSSDHQAIEKSLKDTDQAIGQVTKRLRQTEQKLTDIKQRITALEAQQKELEQIKQQQLKMLTGQIKSAYQIGQHDYLKMMLNQNSPAKLERVLTYYQYLNKARIKEVEKLKLTVVALEKNKQVLTEAQLEFAKLLDTQKNKQTELVKLKQAQKQNLAQLANIIKTDQQQLAALKQDESALSQALKALAEAVEALPKQTNFSGLGQVKGRLLWPTKGRVRDYFGKRKSGELRWKGVVINASAGQVVNNIYAGQVIFSDWLNGYGLVLVVEHGDGYMSLYGHNQALLKDVGDTVHAGEPIALVGQSGGQATPNLYFEIRYQGKPLDPTKWCH